MPSRNPTTVVLTKKAQDIKDDLAPVFGLKNILSAGLILFGELSSDQQKKIIAGANITKTERKPKDFLRDTLRMIKEMIEVEKQQPGTIFRVLDLEEQKILNEFKKVISPAAQKQNEKRKRG